VRSTRGYVVTSPHPFTRIPRWAWIAFAAAVTAWSGWYLTTNYRAAIQLRVADAKAWRIDGPPCPTMTKAAFLKPRQKGARRFEFEGVVFFRRYGHVSCAAIRDKGGRGGQLYPVCQFTSPGDLMIRTEAGDWYFQPGPGQAATVSTAGGAPRCVMASTFSLRPEAQPRGAQPGA